MKKEKALELMQESIDSMQRSGILSTKVVLNMDTILLGSDLTLDSLGFVTFVSDVEERISEETKSEQYIILSEMQEISANSSVLTVGDFAKYIEKITELQ